MDQLLALVVVVPLLVAAAVTACGPLFRSRRRVLDVVAILTAACVAVMLGVIMTRTAGGDQVYWFAGFRPAHGVSIGIDFEVQPLSAGMACLAAVLVTAAMTFSWRYFEQVATYYHALMLTFLAGITGFCLTGDLFDLFVWFELMGVSAYALTAYRPEERGPIQGALNFAITNSVGAYLSLSGIGLIYGQTGALNMAQIGASIARHPAGRLVVVAFLLVIAGLLIKSAIVPFHFWLADAHAVAPTPVCVLFSGVMVELGLYGIARVYWSVFGQALGHRTAISHVFLALGLLTAVTGALFCFRERHIKRMLAFSTISHAGMFLIGIALLTPLGLAGAAVYVIEHGLVKAALFLCTGIVLHRLGSVNEPWLHGRGRPLRVTGVVFTLAGLGLADLPPFATFLGKGWIEVSAGAWLIPVLIVCSSLVGGAVLRVAGGVFHGLGDRPAEDPQMARAAAEETSETTGGKGRTPLTMIVPPAVLVVAAIVVGLIGPLGSAVQAAAVRFEDQAGYNATMLDGAHLTHPVALFAAGSTSVTVADLLAGLGSVAGALILAWLALYWRRLPLLRGYRPNASFAAAARRLQSGVVNDYVTWIVIGLTCLGALFAAIIGLPSVTCQPACSAALAPKRWPPAKTCFPGCSFCVSIRAGQPFRTHGSTWVAKNSKHARPPPRRSRLTQPCVTAKSGSAVPRSATRSAAAAAMDTLSVQARRRCSARHRVKSAGRSLPAVTQRAKKDLQFTADVFPLGIGRYMQHVRALDQFFTDADDGTLPARADRAGRRG